MDSPRSSVSLCCLQKALARGSAEVETWRHWAISFDSSKLALRIFHNRWQECSKPRRGKQSTNHRLVLVHMNLAHADRLVFSPTYFVVVYCVLSLRLSCFVVYSAFNVHKVRECHCYIIYIKILFSNNSFIPLAYAEFDDSFPFAGGSSIPLCYVLFPATFPHQLFFHPL